MLGLGAMFASWHEYNAAFGRVPTASKTDEVKQLGDLLAQLRFGVDAADSMQCKLDKEVTANDMER